MSSYKEPFTAIPNSILASNDFSANDKLVLSYIMSWNRTNLFCESKESLAEHVGLSESTIYNILDDLEQTGNIERRTIKDSENQNPCHLIFVNDELEKRFILDNHKSYKSIAYLQKDDSGKNTIFYDRNGEIVTKLKIGR